jgi:hypothetical protein
VGAGRRAEAVNVFRLEKLLLVLIDAPTDEKIRAKWLEQLRAATRVVRSFV